MGQKRTPEKILQDYIFFNIVDGVAVDQFILETKSPDKERKSILEGWGNPLDRDITYCTLSEWEDALRARTPNFLPQNFVVANATIMEGKEPKLYTCPECGRKVDGDSAHGEDPNRCNMVLGRRGWRQLGVYDG